jgi:hypothetical protein
VIAVTAIPGVVGKTTRVRQMVLRVVSYNIGEMSVYSNVIIAPAGAQIFSTRIMALDLPGKAITIP